MYRYTIHYSIPDFPLHNYERVVFASQESEAICNFYNDKMYHGANIKQIVKTL